MIFHTCTECDGTGQEQIDTEGVLSAVPFNPAGLAERTADEIRAASTVAALRQVQSLFDGLCLACSTASVSPVRRPLSRLFDGLCLACSGPVESWLECCSDHDPTGGCDHCGRQFAAWARFRCRICKNHSTTSPKSLALYPPAMISFYHDYGISTRIQADDFESARHVFDLMDDHEMELVSQDPPRVTVRAVHNGDAVCLTFDEGANVVDHSSVSHDDASTD